MNSGLRYSLQQIQQQCAEIQAIDYFLGRELSNTLCQQSAKEDNRTELLFYSVMALSQALREGHSCLKLSEYADTVYWQETEQQKPGYMFPSLSVWHDCLTALELTPQANKPLVYEYQRLYLRRYWQFEYELAKKINKFLQAQVEIDEVQAESVLSQLFPEPEQGQLDKIPKPDWQKIAVANSLMHYFSIIAGGPGTGKTFTVTRLLTALQILSPLDLKIALLAPTGKAAQRLNESIAQAKEYLLKNGMASAQILDSIPENASTIHRLLGYQYGSHNFRHNENRPLPYDVLLVDEISMIDLPLMARLFRALPAQSRIIMLGDADQLPSVAAGSILSDLAPYKETRFSTANASRIKRLSGYECLPAKGSCYDHLTLLQESHRFKGSGEIGQLAKKVIEGQAVASWTLLKQGQQQIELGSTSSFTDWLDELIECYFRPLFEQQHLLSVEQAFDRLSRFRFLCATRQGEQSVTQVNQRVEDYLRRHGWIADHGDYYPGRPILVTRNHYASDLYNGDTGLLWTNSAGRLQAVFPAGSVNRNGSKKGLKNVSIKDGFRWLSLGRLADIETVYAMTIHKTQGSEFQHVALILPPDDSPILSRELLYTGITRAREQLSVFSSEAVWQQGVARKIQRFSGLSIRVSGACAEKNFIELNML